MTFRGKEPCPKCGVPTLGTWRDSIEFDKTKPEFLPDIHPCTAGTAQTDVRALTITAAVVKLADAAKPDPDALHFARLLLADVESGHVRGFVAIQQDREGVRYVVANAKNRMELLGYLSHMMYQLQTDEGTFRGGAR